ncbi:MAG: hypothetical protein HLUCCO18_07485 [Rhodobacteraceae bacterium HLUCCO18]|nr:MAG: hypothetical protein HLUCCO18_07485 [Rhodobacteraceae bacterium HLUCCO18]
MGDTVRVAFVEGSLIMNTKMITTATAVALVAVPAFAQDVVMENQGADELRGDWVIGATVMSTEGEEIGAIDDVILDAEEGNVTAAVLSVGGFLGLGAKSIAVDWSELQIDWDGSEITLDLTREQAEDAPEYVFRDREYPPPPEPETTTGTGTTGTGTTGTGTTGTGALD